MQLNAYIVGLSQKKYSPLLNKRLKYHVIVPVQRKRRTCMFDMSYNCTVEQKELSVNDIVERAGFKFVLTGKQLSSQRA